MDTRHFGSDVKSLSWKKCWCQEFCWFAGGRFEQERMPFWSGYTLFCIPGVDWTKVMLRSCRWNVTWFASRVRPSCFSDLSDGPAGCTHPSPRLWPFPRPVLIQPLFLLCRRPALPCFLAGETWHAGLGIMSVGWGGGGGSGGGSGGRGPCLQGLPSSPQSQLKTHSLSMKSSLLQHKGVI